ncbi:hypothetical protein [Actinomycetospora cinnamomea]|uniref:Uncharacterized protein n=1 Tax=Actinomycetospora cinnamomea TaxID=663609 RepID=A0A2U1FPW1_9PSEU|nr:hypothetical protein [Actinomycetospora cinnamomea]PVZ14233.1 hypothetical protein C8D89_10197 [Actinomycetospora cinnamomea]
MSGWREDVRRGEWRSDTLRTWAWEAWDEGADEFTPIFRAVASDWERRGRAVERRAVRHARASATTTPPVLPRARPAEDELEHPAEHGREAEVVPFTAHGRHAVTSREEDSGRHACKIVRLVPRA